MRLELDSFKTKGFRTTPQFHLCPVMAGRSNTARQPVAQKTWPRQGLCGWIEYACLTYVGQAIKLFSSRRWGRTGGHLFCVTPSRLFL
jgi:hypothetical protein